jgi:hypothetical protein
MRNSFASSSGVEGKKIRKIAEAIDSKTVLPW